MPIVKKLSGTADDAASYRAAAACLRGGGLVAFPTETVYGLGALALEEAAVARIFAAKGRPLADPLIVHIHDRAQIAELAQDFPPLAQRLAAAFWPGPLTMTLPKRAAVPDIVTAGGPTVALRLPADERALALLQAVAAPLAAPSANRLGRISPTRAEHVLAELGARIELLLDGGPAGYGLESTVVDLTTAPPRILRPGAITLEQLRRVAPDIALAGAGKSDETLRSPGLLPAHYAPAAELWLAHGVNAAELLAAECAKRRAAGKSVGWLALTEDAALAAAADEIAWLGSERDAGECARRLYHALRRLDESGHDCLLARALPERGIGRAINDRLRRAARGRLLPNPATLRP